MDRHPESQALRRRAWVLGLISAVALALVVISQVVPTSGRITHMQVEWRGPGAWTFGLKRLAYCSEQKAAFRGWRADLGPVMVLRLRSTFTIPEMDKAVHASTGGETNDTPVAGPAP